MHQVFIEHYTYGYAQRCENDDELKMWKRDELKMWTKRTSCIWGMKYDDVLRIHDDIVFGYNHKITIMEHLRFIRPFISLNTDDLWTTLAIRTNHFMPINAIYTWRNPERGSKLRLMHHTIHKYT